jgi:hypothetical protein
VENYSPSLEFDQRIDRVMKGEMDYDLVVFGSSRSARAIIAEDVQEQTGLSTYNMSYHGSNTDFHEFILRMYLTHNRAPKLIVLGVDDYNSFIREKTVFRTDKLYPFTKYPDIIDELVRRGEKIPGISNLLCSHRINRSALFFTKRVPNKFNQFSSNGSITIEGSDKQFLANNFDYDMNERLYPTDQESDTLIAKYKAIISLCASYGIELLVAVPPNYRHFTSGFRERLEQISAGRTKIFYCNEEKPEYRKLTNFYDAEHLNIVGAKHYTKDLIAFIKQSYKIN